MIKKWLTLLVLLVLFNTTTAQNYKDRINDILIYAELNGGSKIKATHDSLNYAYNLAIQKEDEELQAYVLNSLIRHSIAGFSSFEKAAEYAEKIYELARKNKNSPFLLAMYHNSLGVLYYNEIKNSEKAFNEFEKSLHILEDNGLEPNYHFLNNYALAYMQNGKQKKAIQLLCKARKSYQQYDGSYKDPIYPFTNALNLGVSFIYDNKLDSSEYFFNEALKFATENLNARQIFSAHVFLGVFYQENNRYDSALKHLSSADSLVIYGDSYAKKVLLYESFSELYSALKDYKKAYNHMNLVSRYKDSLNQLGIEEQIIALEFKMELEALKVNQELQLKEKELQRAGLFKRIIVIVSVLLISLLVILFLLFKINKQKEINRIKADNEALEKERIKQQAALDLMKKEEQLISANMEISVRENELNALKNRLNEHLDKSYDPQFDDLRKLLNQIKYSEKKNEQLKNLDAVVSLNSNKFYTKLKELHPKLTESEMRLLSLIRLNLGNDELLLIFNISKSSLNTKRYRIRKKMGLASEDSLEDYIMGL